MSGHHTSAFLHEPVLPRHAMRGISIQLPGYTETCLMYLAVCLMWGLIIALALATLQR
ncbi:MAG TPA: hypothetical protein VKX16_19790 [Chloroflexota bacterium]|nr:hypothetical protein [Chloroflexota bacterium]